MRLLLVALFLQLGKHVERDVEHIGFRPYGTTVGGGIFAVVATVGRQRQGYLVFIVVVLVVATHADKHGELVVLQVGIVGNQMVGVDEHLHLLVLAQVETGVAIHGLRLTSLQILHHHVEGLFVGLYELGLRGVGYSRDTRRQHIVYRLLVVILLDVYSTYLEKAALSRRGAQTLLVDAPLATHKVERTETQHDGFLEARHEHAHESDRGKVVDRTHLALVLRERNTELVPVDVGGVAIAQLYTTGSHIGDETIVKGSSMAVGFEDLGRDSHLVLVVAFKLVEGVVCVDILNIRTALVTGIVTLGLVFRIGRVALGIVEALIAVENALFLAVEVGATEVVVVVACGVVTPSLDDAVVGNHATVHHGVEPLLIRSILALLVVVQTIQTYILHLARTTGGNKGVGLGGGIGHLTPLGGGIRFVAIHGHGTLVELLAVVQDILTHLSQIEVEVATIV